MCRSWRYSSEKLLLLNGTFSSVLFPNGEDSSSWFDGMELLFSILATFSLKSITKGILIVSQHNVRIMKTAASLLKKLYAFLLQFIFKCRKITVFIIVNQIVGVEYYSFNSFLLHYV